MATKIQLSDGDPVGQKLLELIPIKANELGWYSEDSSLSEYVVMMFSSPKSEDEIVKELTSELLQPEDRGAPEFAHWLFTTIPELRGESNGGSISTQPIAQTEMQQTPGGEMDVDSAPSDNIPTGPKSMRNSSRPRRNNNMLGQISKHMDRTNDSVLHRVRNSKGSERVNSHSREPPKGPRGQQATRLPRGPAGRPTGPMGMSQMQGSPGMGMGMNMSPQQQMQMLQLYEQQALMMSQMLNAKNNPRQFAADAQLMGLEPQSTHSRSLFDRVDSRQKWNKRPGHKGPSVPASALNPNVMTDTSNEPSSSMEVEASQPDPTLPPSETTCRFNLKCTNADCGYAHQSPSAPPGVPIDVHDKCTFGAACLNFKCVASHPSPAQKLVHKAEMDCKYFPNCTNPGCPFKHPAMPLCRFGGDCSKEGCKFTHLQTKCRFKPCKNANCPYKHDEGQRGTFTDKVWVADEVKGGHVSERKFVDEEKEEELIIPGSSSSDAGASLTAGMEVH
ncbi:MAG: hypothetical protein M1814_000859 [Vezdaea aestivalis]|nr:MAG: hypothetical protein M1814_000859 [Vezdaea aestivalis]